MENPESKMEIQPSDLNTALPFSNTSFSETQQTDIVDSSDDDENFEFGNEENCLIKLSSSSLNEFRLIKNAIEDALIRQCKKMENIEKPVEEKFVFYYNKYSIDKVGKPVAQGETGIAEGWSIPIYVNEFQNLLGLPFHEDNALAETNRIKRPRLECFNCLATNHRVTECPVKVDHERINIHKRIFSNQSAQALGQAELFSTRYTDDSKDYRGFKPGEISSQLKQALGVKDNQLPPYIYLMRELGYPIGWLLEAQVKKSDLELVHEQDGEEKKLETPEKVVNEYDADRIVTYPGFNEPPPQGILDESDRYGVERYNKRLSKEEFLKTLNVRKKRSFHRRLKAEATAVEAQSDEEDKSSVEDGMIATEEELSQESEESKKSKQSEEECKPVIVIPGTPIISNPTDVKHVPNWEKFSENICEHKPFDMENVNASGSYQNIVKLTREFKTKVNSSSQ